jgi:hypothetical protein
MAGFKDMFKHLRISVEIFVISLVLVLLISFTFTIINYVLSINNFRLT